MNCENNEILMTDGEIFTDSRGRISSLNNFRFLGVERVYFIHHNSVDVIRGWHGHQFEKKWFYCIKGSFIVALVQVDNWEKPSSNFIPEVFQLTEAKKQILCVPEGNANCIKAKESNSTLMVFSGKIIEEALTDSWRYESSMWIDWSKY